ncbi:serine/threonine protein phosphatase [Hymenobacter lutimineralis]|uniref:Serine/threonine protein phosphatase n=1 Tax=Hymenobacter lutimineralis TaxID=2606448 RepID=A0A5D6V7Y6_9BACT|nr:metallophosphoesterase family protein [Hymenobacter lutimineralis]TYZ11387.1 serine/threonine protein phosphatase [Hymenobacter lutimineralis]
MARYVTTDIHGCLRTLRRALEEVIQFTPRDELYVLGDYVNKGPDSKGVLDYLIQLQAHGLAVHCLRGNHDQELLDAAQGRTAALWASAPDRAQTLRSFGVPTAAAIPEVYIRWLEALPYEVELPDFVLVHAGFDFRQPPEQMRQDHHTMMNIKHFTFDASRLQGKRLVHGHVPTPAAEAKRLAQTHAQVLRLDTGCVYRHNPELAQLSVLNLDTYTLHQVPNCELPYPIARRPA